MKTDTNRGYCTSEEETTCESKKVAWFTFWDNDFADKVELDLRGRELIQENGKWFAVKKNVNNNEHNSIDRNVNDICDDILINQVTNKVAIISLKSDVCDDAVELNLGDYEIEIRDNKTYAVLKKPKYPKTFIEVLNFWHPDRHIEDDYQRCYKKDLIEKFQDLLYARAAYWKIAGEQMGLGKSWKPDWTNDEYKFVIGVYENEIIKCYNRTAQFTLAFPTEEIRDAFYENFKELIEKCKELL